jgi:hypothetical protein
MERKKTLSHDALDAFVATILGWCERRLGQKSQAAADVAFSDEWERQQIERELHWN